VHRVSCRSEDVDAPTLYVMIGLPGVGKTTRARQIEATVGAVRLMPDDWMIPLFGEPEAGGKRDVLEGLLVSLAERLLRLGVDVVLDFGVWARDERNALRDLAGTAGARCELLFLDVSAEERSRRMEARQAVAPETTFPMSGADLDHYRTLFEAPDTTELSATVAPPPPVGYATWAAWRSQRWPT
jgi:predicted kinase